MYRIKISLRPQSYQRLAVQTNGNISCSTELGDRYEDTNSAADSAQLFHCSPLPLSWTHVSRPHSLNTTRIHSTAFHRRHISILGLERAFELNDHKMQHSNFHPQLARLKTDLNVVPPRSPTPSQQHIARPQQWRSTTPPQKAGPTKDPPDSKFCAVVLRTRLLRPGDARAGS